MAPGTEFARDFCVGIGPLQLGVVLVEYLSNMHTLKLEFLSTVHDGNRTLDHYILEVHIYTRCMYYQFDYMDTGPDTISKPYIIYMFIFFV